MQKSFVGFFCLVFGGCCAHADLSGAIREYLQEHTSEIAGPDMRFEKRMPQKKESLFLQEDIRSQSEPAQLWSRKEDQNWAENFWERMGGVKSKKSASEIWEEIFPLDNRDGETQIHKAHVALLDAVDSPDDAWMKGVLKKMRGQDGGKVVNGVWREMNFINDLMQKESGKPTVKFVNVLPELFPDDQEKILVLI